jgi:hypothetical protein
MQYFVGLGSHIVNPVDTDTWHVEIPWDAYPNPVDGTRITGMWVRRTSGNAGLTLKSVCPSLQPQEDGSVLVVWMLDWSVGGSALAEVDMVGLVSDGVTQPPV